MQSRVRIGAAIGLLVALSLTAFLLVSKSAPGESITGAPAQKGKTMPVVLEITIGEKGDEIVRRSGLKIKRSQVSTALLYDASPDRTGVMQEVIVKTSSHRVTLPVSDSILFYDDTVDPYGVEQVDLNLKLPKPPKDASKTTELEIYDRAIYTLVTDVIARINKAGWKRYIDPDEPRLSERITYSFQSVPTSAYQPGRGTEIHPDPNYRLGFEEWQSLPSTTNLSSWQWYADGVFITLDYSKAPRVAGVPMIEHLRLTVQSERMRLVAYDPTRSGDLSAALMAYREAAGKRGERRHAEEAKARAAGLKILEDWIDPPIGNVAVPHK